jgi:hypothetical protein
MPLLLQVFVLLVISKDKTMKPTTHISLALAIMFSALPCAAEPALKLPPMMFYSTLEDSLFEALKKESIFTQLDKELYGGPLRIIVTHTFTPTAGGTATGLTSAILSGSSLGIIPIVSNSDLVITYTLAAHGKTVATFSYSENFTQASNLYSNKGVYHLDKRSMSWVLTTVNKFVNEVQKNQEVRTITEEYNFYFGKTSK